MSWAEIVCELEPFILMMGERCPFGIANAYAFACKMRDS